MAALPLTDLGPITVRVLAVAGGAAIAAFLTSGVAGIFVRWLFHKQQPRAARRLLRLTGGLAGGLAVAMVVFSGHGGWGIGGTGNGQRDGTESRASLLDRPTEPSTRTKPEPTRIRVVMLGGDLVKNGAAYRIDGEHQARKLADVQQLIRQRLGADPPPAGIDILIYDNSVARDTAAVDDLEQWARQNGMAVTIVTTGGDIPP
jgi:hypothetical protein